MKEITLQDIFNAAWQAFIIERRKPCVFYDEHSLYDFNKYMASYSQNGNHCAIGWALPHDRTYYGSFPTVIKSNRELFDANILGAGEMSMEDFQRMLHDEHINRRTGEWEPSWHELRREYIRVAVKYNLFFPV